MGFGMAAMTEDKRLASPRRHVVHPPGRLAVPLLLHILQVSDMVDFYLVP